MAAAYESSTPRALFVRLMNIIETESDMCLKVMAFWMWLEAQGYQEIMRNICSCDDEVLARIYDEAKSVLSCLQPNSTTPLSANLLRITTTVARQHCFRLGAVFADKGYVSRGIADVHRDACSAVFKDIVKEPAGTKGGNAGDDASIWERRRMVLPGAESYSNSKYVQTILNPSAKEWNPSKERAPEESRCLFLTFSNGYPLNEHQIATFFKRRYGPHVERVYVHWPEPKNRKVPPLFGKVVFTASWIPAVILSGRDASKFWVDGKPLWCKKFDPKKKTN